MADYIYRAVKSLRKTTYTYCTVEKFMELSNSSNPDQTPGYAASDLHINCLPM